MSEDKELEGVGADTDETMPEEMVEIDWTPLQEAVNVMAEEGLDFTDNTALLDHMAALLATLLRKVQAEEKLTEERLTEVAAEMLSFAIDLAVGEEELPEFVAEDELIEN